MNAAEFYDALAGEHGATPKALAEAGIGFRDLARFEINEAFACLTMAAMHDIGLDHSNVNVNGGACALGHPIGATGARLIVTLLHALEAKVHEQHGDGAQLRRPAVQLRGKMGHNGRRHKGHWVAVEVRRTACANWNKRASVKPPVAHAFHNVIENCKPCCCCKSQPEVLSYNVGSQIRCTNPKCYTAIGFDRGRYKQAELIEMWNSLHEVGEGSVKLRKFKDEDSQNL